MKTLPIPTLTVLGASLAFSAACRDAGERSDPAQMTPAPSAAPAAEPAAEPPPRKALAPNSGEHRGEHRWSRSYGSEAPDAARALARGPKGDLWLAGYFKGAQPFAGDEVADGGDAFLTRLDPRGEVRWSIALGGPGLDTGDAAAVDAEGNSYVAGSFSESLRAGGESLPSAGADDIFIAKFAADGRRLWVKRYGGIDIDAAHAVAVAPDGGLYATGVFRSEVAFGSETLASAGDADIFLLKLDAEGALSWAKRFGGAAADFGRALAVDSRGELLFLGEFSRAVDFGAGPLNSNGNRDVVLAKFSAAGELRWASSFGTHLDELALGLAVDPADHVAITGSFDDVLAIGDSQLRSAGTSDVYIAKYSPEGKPLWARAFGGADEDIGHAITADAAGNLYATGWFWFSIDFGGGERVSRGKKDVFVVKLDPAGDHLWSQSFGGAEVDFGKGVAATENGVAVAGTFHYTAHFGGETLGTPPEDRSVAPSGDIFLVELGR